MRQKASKPRLTNMIATRIEERAKAFQRSGDLEEVKRRREEGQVELRKQKRSEQAAKRRALLPSSPVPLTAQSLAALVQSIRTGGEAEAVREVATLLAGEEAPLMEAVSLGVIPLFVGLLEGEETVATNAAWALNNLSAGPSEATAAIVHIQGLPVLCQALDRPSAPLVDYCICTLANICGDSVAYRDLVISQGVPEKVFRLLRAPQDTDIAFVDNMTWLLSQFFRGPLPADALVEPAIALSPYLLSSSHSGIVSNCCWMLTYMTDQGTAKWLDQVMTLGIAPRLIDLTQSHKDNERIPALRTIGNVLFGEDKYVQTLLNLGLLDKLMIMVTNRKREIRKEAIWCCSNIAGGSKDQEKAVILHSGFSLLVTNMTDSDPEIRKEAVFCVANLAKSPDSESLSRLLAYNVLEALVQVLRIPEPDTLLVALEAISRILRAAGVSSATKAANEVSLRFEEMSGISLLESLQRHHNLFIYEKAVEMLNEFFGLEDSAERIEEGVPQGGFQFS